MYSIGLKSGLFLRLNAAFRSRSKSKSNSCNTEYLVLFKLKYETL